MLEKNLKNIPDELKRQKRWVGYSIINGKKIPDPAKGWNTPANWKNFDDIGDNKGFIITETTENGLSYNYLVLDFDHVVDPKTGKFVNSHAQSVFNRCTRIPTFYERSLSKSGYHFFFKPTAGKFSALGGKYNIPFVEGGSEKLEIF